MKKNQETKAFSQILDIIRTHRAGALASVNIEHLLSRWEIGAYISAKIKHDGWGNATIDRLVDYIHANAPDERGYGRRNLYNMVSVYEAFTSPEFTDLVLKYGDSIVQSATGQIVQTATAQMPPVGIVQTPSAQFQPLAVSSFSNLLEIVNRTKTAQERLFYVVYAFRERLDPSISFVFVSIVPLSADVLI